MLTGLIKYNQYLSEPAKLSELNHEQRRHRLTSMVCLSKFLGCYEEYKQQLKQHEIRWSGGNTALNGFLSIINKQHNTLPQHVKEAWIHLDNSEQIFLKFLCTSGLRVSEAIYAFNQIIKLHTEGKLCEYYDEQLMVLQHFKYQEQFLRRTKNAFITFINKEQLQEICRCQTVSYNRLHCRFRKLQLKLKFKSLRSYNNSFMRKQGVMSELIELVSGRIPSSVFVRHYLGIGLDEARDQLLPLQDKLLKELGLKNNDL